MNDLHEPRLTTQPVGDDVDALLRRFYRAEMPNPWPAPPAPAEAPRSILSMPRRSFRWHSPRLAMAAAVALFFIGYLWLFSAFPSHDTLVEQPHGKQIGFKKDLIKAPSSNGLDRKDFEPLPQEFELLPKGGKASIRGFGIPGSKLPRVEVLTGDK